MVEDDLWIQGAVKKPGRLREYIQRRFGKKGFTPKGTIKVNVQKQILKDPNVTESIKKSVRLSLRFRKLSKLKGK